MNKIIPPLKLKLIGPAVSDLQDALQLLLDRGVLLADDEAIRNDLSVELKDERAIQTYGGGTKMLVKRFQEERHLKVSEEVDEPTANAINAILHEWGLLEQAGVERNYVVSGKVQREDALPMQGIRVRAFHKDARGAIGLGEDTTDGEGRYTIRYELVPGLDAVNLLVTVLSKDGRILQRSNVIQEAKPLEILDLNVPVDEPQLEHQRIEGQILFEHNLPGDNLRLRLYRLDFGGQETLLSETKTLTGGQYAFDFHSGGKAPILEVRAVNEDNHEIVLSKPLNNLKRESREVLNLIAPGTLQPLTAEYQRLLDDLLPHIGHVAALAEARENAEHQDLTILNRNTGWDARLIALAVITEQLTADPEVGLQQEGLYGLLRAGLPSDKLLLAQVEPDVVEHALKTVRDAGIVDINDDQIGEFKQQFSTFSNTVRLNTPAPGSRSTYGNLLKISGLPPDAQDRFMPVYLNHQGDADELWDEARKVGLDNDHISTLQLQGKFALLAGNSEQMTARLLEREISDPVQLIEEDLYRAESWAEEVFSQAGITPDRRHHLTEEDRNKLTDLIPVAYAAENVELSLQSYTEDMARKMRLSFPTQVVSRLLETDDKFKLPQAHNPTSTLLHKAAGVGFRLGETPVNAFFKAHPELTENDDPTEAKAAWQQLRTLQRIYQMTPNDESMPVLMSLNITSAYDVMEYTADTFTELFNTKYVEIFSKTPASGLASMVRRKAEQINSVTQNLFIMAKKTENEIPTASLPAPAEVAMGVRKELIKQSPTMESLLGSMDYCECEHCRSVLSPAAYLVDLLQFIDPKQDVFLNNWKASHKNQDYPHKDKNGKAITPYDALVERRPDLPHIPLTCENSHTAMPYIDLVNEILEFYVAHGKLSEEAAHNTGNATTAELLAEPQNIINKAYDKLRQVSYPLNLPFDLWIETARQFCDYFDTPLPKLLEVFLPGDEVFAPVQPFDRATIFMELLGLSPAEVAVFTNPDPFARWYELYGFNSAEEALTIATDKDTGQRIDMKSAKALSRRLGITYKEITSIVQTQFVNQELGKLSLLYKLGVKIHDARSYLDNKALLTKDTSTLTKEEAKQQVEVKDFSERLKKLSDIYKLPLSDLETTLQAIPFSDILVLADPNTGCDFDLTTLQYADNSTPADAIALLRINLFVRLWRKLGWTIEETDRALCTFIPKTAPLDKDPENLKKQPLKTALIYLSHLKELSNKFNIGQQSLQKLLTLWSDIPTTGKNSLYTQLFLRPSVLKSGEVHIIAGGSSQPVSVFDDALGQYLLPAGLKRTAEQVNHKVYLQGVKAADKIEGEAFAGEKEISLHYNTLEEVQYLSYAGILSDSEKARLAAFSPSGQLSKLLDAVQVKANEFMLIKGHMLALQGAIGLTYDEIRLILTDSGKPIENAELSVPNVSLLYRYIVLAKALKLSVSEMINLKQLSGLDPFMPLHPDPLIKIQNDNPFSQTLKFVKIGEAVKLSGFTVEDLNYLLRHRYDETGKYRSDNEGVLVLLRTISEGIRAIRAEHAIPDDPDSLSEELLRQKLGLALTPGVVERLLTMVNGAVEFTATQAGVEKPDQLTPAIFASETAIRELSYKEVPLKEQKLTYRGVLFDAQKAELQAKFETRLNESQKPVFMELLGSVQKQAHDFFNNQLKKQKLRLEDEAGFLDEEDFAGLFLPLMPLKLLKVVLPTDTKEEIGIKLKENEGIEKENEGIEKENQKTLKQRRNRIGQAFLPSLQQRLIRQLIVQTMTTHSGAPPVLVESLITDERLLTSDGKPLSASFTPTGEMGVSALFFDSEDLSGAAQGAGTIVRSVNTSLKDSHDTGGNPLKSANSARFEGYLEVPTPGAYRFYIELDRKDSQAELHFTHLPNPVFLKGSAGTEKATLGNHIELKPGLPYHFILELKKLNGSGARLLVQGETLPKIEVSQLMLYPLSTITRAQHAILLLTKALQLVQGLGLSEREIRYLLTHPEDFGGVNLSRLPTRSDGDTLPEKIAATEHFSHFLRLAAYVRLKLDLAARTNDLVDIFEVNGTGNMEKVYTIIAKLTRRDEATVRVSSRALFATPSFASEINLVRLWDLLQVVERFGVPVASLQTWPRLFSAGETTEQRYEIIRDLKEAIKARFEPETWQRVAQPIFDKLRQRQRDSLVSYVLHQLSFHRMEQLYEYFLIDPGMEPVVQTSRIRLAIASAQLFIQRSLLNLEPKVHPSTINSKYWAWMKRYRVWEANRKIFLYPENWLEPEFRDDKTHLFTELEGSLLQGDVSSDLVEDAFLSYLKKLDKLARLNIVAMYIEDTSDPAPGTLHVFGRNFDKTPLYFYRRYNQRMWTAWEPVSAEIEGDHLAPVMWRDRLYLFWVTFLEKASSENNGSRNIKPGESIAIPAVKKDVEAHLNWSEYLQGEWSTREADAKTAVVKTGLYHFNSKNVFVHISKEYDFDGSERGVNINLGGVFNSGFYLAGRNSSPEPATYDSKPNNPYKSANQNQPNYYSGNNILSVTIKHPIRKGREANSIPFWHLHHHKSGDHLYTIWDEERRKAQSKHGYTYIGIACYVLPKDSGAGVPLFRLVHRESWNHLYTISTVELENAQKYNGYEFEDIACFVLLSGDRSGVPLYRLNKGTSRIYTISEEEAKKRDSEDYKLEGIACNVFHQQEHLETRPILQQVGRYSILPSDNDLSDPGFSDLRKPVYYQDNKHTFFMEPNVTEYTVVKWPGWVAQTPRPEIASDIRNWRDISVMPKIPVRGPVIVSDESWRVPNFSGSLISPKPDHDWLINPRTGFLFGGIVIGPTGRSGGELLTNTAATGFAGSVQHVQGSQEIDLASGYSDTSVLEQTGLIQVAGGLNIVGGAGINLALRQNAHIKH